MTAPHLRPDELADRWRISQKTLARWRWTGDGPLFLKVSGKVLYRREDVAAFEAAHVRSRTDERATPMAVESFASKRGRQRHHGTLASPSASGDRIRGLA